MSREDTTQWLTSKPMAAYLRRHRDNDVKVEVNGIDVPVVSIRYDPIADFIRIELFHGDDYRVALTTDPVPGLD